MRTTGFRSAIALALFSLLTPALAGPTQPPDGDVQDLELRIQGAEYAITAHEGRLQAPNRAHGFRTFFSEKGIRAVPRLEREGTWEWSLQWVGYGRGSDIVPVPAATVAPQGSRIEYRRGALTEWYVNSSRGLEQGFELAVRPEGSDAPVHLDLALTGSLFPVFSENGQAIDFLTAEGVRVLRYAELHVTDTRGGVVPSRMEGIAGGVRLVLDDRDAVYPLAVDPVTTSPVWTNESNQATAEFGRSVGTAGDVNGDGYSDLIVGAPFYDNGETDEGRAYVYLGSASGLALSPSWTVESDQAGARFGWTVGTAGDVNGDGYADVIVGAPRYDNGETDEGRAYVYLGSASGLSTSAAWTNESNQASAQYATSVATAGDVNGDGYTDVIVGAPLYDNGQSDEGRAFVYLGSASGLAAAPVWTAESDQASAQFGFSVSTAGDVNGDGFADVGVGAPLLDNGQTDEGKAFVYHGTGGGVNTSPSWFQEGNQGGAQFGWSVGPAGDIDGSGYADFLVGAWQFTNDQTMEGRAFLYLGNASGLAFFAIRTIESDNANAYMGWSVGPAGDVNGDGFADILVTAPFYSVSVSVGGGQARVYLGSEFGLASSYTWSVLRQTANCAYGWSAATAGDVDGDGFADIAVGAPWDENGQTNEGMVYVYRGSQSFISSTPAWTEGNQTSAQLGTSVSTAGDVNGDGYADMIIGAPFYDDGEPDEGRAFLYIGSATGLISTLWLAEGDQASAQFGASVSTAGDVNGDGYDDVIIGAQLYDNGQGDEGRAFVYLGSAGGLAAIAAWTNESNQASAQYAASVAGAGDVNGDGYGDVIVGSPLYDNGQADEGRAWLYLGSAAGLAAAPAWTAEADQASADFGKSVRSAGDVNGDGFGDVILGSPKYDNGAPDGGRAVVYLGTGSGLAATPTWTKDGTEPSGKLGTSVAGAGDTNGDGYSDVLVGTPFASPAHADVYLGYNLGVFTTAAFTATAEGTNAQSQFGISVAGLGDVNGDGYADIGIGAPQYDVDHSENLYGWVSIIYGSATGPTNLGSSLTSTPQEPNDRSGTSVAGAGDVNGDGYADVVFGSPFYDNGQNDEGRAFVHFGGGAECIALNPRQRSSTGARAISRGGVSDSGSSFRLGGLARTPYGRGKARLEWEVKPAGTFFNGIPSGTGSTLVDTGITGGPLEELVSNLQAGTRYHWRVRLVYDPASVPFARRSRWVTMPWGGWQEAMLRTGATGAGRASTFTITKVGGGVTISWSGASSCLPDDFDYAIYEGTLGNFTSHHPVACATFPAHSWNFTPAAGNRYFLLVPVNSTREGSYGLGAGGAERAQGTPACKGQQIAACP